MRLKALAGTALLAALSGCATKPAPPAAKPEPPRVVVVPKPPPPVRLGVLVPDALLMPDVAAALSDRLVGAWGAGDGDSAPPDIVTAPVSMEVAQLSLECVAPTNDCYATVGRFMRVDRLFWGQIGRGDGGSGVKITVVLLDVGQGTPLGRAERSFAEPTAAIAGLDDMVAESVGRPSKSVTANMPESEASPAPAGGSL
jgi:hypothetical protein